MGLNRLFPTMCNQNTFFFFFEILIVQKYFSPFTDGKVQKNESHTLNSIGHTGHLSELNPMSSFMFSQRAVVTYIKCNQKQTYRVAENLQSSWRSTCQHNQFARELGNDRVQHHGGPLVELPCR